MEQLGLNGFIGAAFVLSAIVISQEKSQNSKEDTAVDISKATLLVLVISEENHKKLTSLGLLDDIS
ncbi:hypothetical protein [Trichormus azollae]|uniref:Uncharacterized protein n=1 Tax=Nostoc azollae (strain 0708) TaxID=551115 RepID=D7DWP4_NOSA0|nr:hypothetical protein [Trichormus azollae]ADI65707.1 hypothetical protein Aazo_4383 ['Nostoc azollae' 0708]